MKHYLIDFKNSIDDITIQAYLTDNQCIVIKQYQKIEKVFLVESQTQPPQTDIIESIHEDQILLSISPLEVLTPYSVPTEINIDTDAEKDWWKVYSIKNIDIGSTDNNIPIYGNNVNVYIMDSGIDTQHEEFTNRNISLLYSITDDYIDETGHGTAVASLIAGKTCGLTCPNVKIIKLWDADHQALQSQILSALDAILLDSLNSNGMPSVVNMSWGIAKNSYIDSKIQILLDAGVIVVAAAGNTGIPINDITPASIPMVITVGSYGQDFIPSDFSSYTDPTIVNLSQNATNYGELDVWAPGEKIYAAQANGGYGFVAGTSFSAAIYSGEVIYTISQHFFRFGMEGISVIYDLIDNIDRTGLLDLHDSKYINSKNKICTYAKNYQRNQASPINFRHRFLWAKIGKRSYVPFYIPEKTVSYEILGTMPEDVKVEGEFLIYEPKESTQDPQKLEEFKFQIKLSNIDGTEFINDIVLLKINNDYDLPTITVGDQAIRIEPAAGTPSGGICASSYWASYNSCGDFHGNCRTFDCYTSGIGKSATCRCA